METKERHAKIVEFFRRQMDRPHGLLEVRGLGGPAPVSSGLYDSPIEAARAALYLDKAGASVFYALNPISSASDQAKRVIEAKKLNKLVVGAAKAPRDNDAWTRWQVLIDIDPVRPSGVCSTEDEKAHAAEVAFNVQAYLAQCGWAEPTLIDSGNGYHLLYATRGLIFRSDYVKNVLRHIAATFDTAHAHVDQSVFNMARIARMPYTTNRKGKHSEERPHRMAEVLNYGAVPMRPAVESDKWLIAGLLDEEMLTKLAGRGGYKNRGELSDRQLVADEQDINDFCETYELAVFRTHQEVDRTYFELEECPFNGGQHRGQRTGKGKTSIILGPTYIGFKCFSDDCADKNFGDLCALLSKQSGIPVHPNEFYLTEEEDAADDASVVAPDETTTVHEDSAMQEVQAVHAQPAQFTTASPITPNAATEKPRLNIEALRNMNAAVAAAIRAEAVANPRPIDDGTVNLQSIDFLQRLTQKFPELMYATPLLSALMTFKERNGYTAVCAQEAALRELSEIETAVLERGRHVTEHPHTHTNHFTLAYEMPISRVGYTGFAADRIPVWFRSRQAELLVQRTEATLQAALEASCEPEGSRAA